MEKKNTSHITAGTTAAIAAIVMFFLYYFTGKSFESSYISLLPYLLTLIIIVYFVLQYAKFNQYAMPFGKLFGYGFSSTMVFALLIAVFMFLIFYVMPQYKAQYIDVMKRRMAAEKTMLEGQKDLAFSTAENYFRTIMIGTNLFMNLITGTLASIIGAAVAKKDLPPAAAQKL